jgi:two-component sensor histidine kinase
VGRRAARVVDWVASRWRSTWHIGLAPRSPAALVFAVACVAIATLVRKGLGLISPDSAVFAPYYSATLVAALVGGAEAGVLSAAVGGLVGDWLFVPPSWGIEALRLEQVVSLILYGTSSVVIIWAAQSYRGLLPRLRAEEATRQLLNIELVHRIKNILAGVQAIVGQSLRNQDDLLETVSGRLAALGATNDLLVRSEWQSAPLREILLQEFVPYGLARFQLHGDDVECAHAIAVPVALMIHELTTNSVKYGALSSPFGQVALTWSLAAGQLSLVWVESGGPKPRALAREGFGTRLLRSGARQFNGSVDRQFEPSGMRCEIALTMPEQRKQSTVEAARLASRNRGKELVSPAEPNAAGSS